MKVLVVFLFVFGIALTANAQAVKTKVVNATSLRSLDSLNLNFCDTFSIEINGLYSPIKSLPSSQSDYLIVKQLLVKSGFKKVDWGTGNWDKGPRFIYLKYSKGNCNCSLYKKYYFNKKMKDGSFDLRISERIICNTDKFMDE